MCTSRTAVESAPDKPGHAIASSSSQYNIGNLVELVHRLHNLLLPLLLFNNIVKFIIRWESPVVTSCVWFLSVIIVYHMETGHVIFCSFMTLAGIAGFGALIRQSQTQTLGSTPHRKLITATSGNTGTASGQPRLGSSKRDAEIENRQRMLEEFRQLMVQSQEMLLACCNMIEYCQEVLVWGQPVLSPLFYTISFLALVVFSLLPSRWFIIVAISCVFGANHQCYSSLMNMHITWRSPSGTKVKGDESAEKEVEKESDGEPLQTTKEVLVQSPEIRIDGASTQTPTPNTPTIEDSTEDESKHPFPTALGSVSSSVRERASTAPESAMRNYDKPSESGDSPSTSGHCFQCRAAFTSVLKRRKYCRHCGNDFCSKCCKHKLPRSAFGATAVTPAEGTTSRQHIIFSVGILHAPAAQTEKELVCNACFIQLTAEESPNLIN